MIWDSDNLVKLATLNKLVELISSGNTGIYFPIPSLPSSLFRSLLPPFPLSSPSPLPVASSLLPFLSLLPISLPSSYSSLFPPFPSLPFPLPVFAPLTLAFPLPSPSPLPSLLPPISLPFPSLLSLLASLCNFPSFLSRLLPSFLLFSFLRPSPLAPPFPSSFYSSYSFPIHPLWDTGILGYWDTGIVPLFIYFIFAKVRGRGKGGGRGREGRG